MRWANFAKVRQGNVGTDGEIEDQAFALSIFCDESNASFDGIFWFFTVQNGAVNCYGTAIVFIYTKDSAHDFCTASAHEACYAEDFAFAQGEGDFVVKTFWFKVINTHYNFSWCSCTSRIELIDRTTYHVAYYFIYRNLSRWLRNDGVTITHNRDRIAFAKYLFHTVRDIYDCHAAGFHFAHHFEQCRRFTLCEGCCRFVHDDNLSI